MLWDASADPAKAGHMGPPVLHSCGEGRPCTQRLCRSTHKTKSGGYTWFRSVTTQGRTYKILFGSASEVEDKKLVPIYQLCPIPRSKPEPQLNMPLYKHCIEKL